MSRNILPRQMNTSVGALINTWNDVAQKNSTLAPFIDSLDRDVRKNLVWADPDNLEKAAVSADNVKWYDKAKQLRADAVVLRERMKTRTPAQVTNEIAWSRGWTDFLVSWDTFKAHVSNCAGGPSFSTEEGCGSLFLVSDAMEQHNSYDSNFRRFHNEFASKFSAPTFGLPKTEAEIKKEHPDTPLIGSGGTMVDIPWTPILVIAGIFFATRLIGSVGSVMPTPTGPMRFPARSAT
jgi:hypothetical protein